MPDGSGSQPATKSPQPRRGAPAARAWATLLRPGRRRSPNAVVVGRRAFVPWYQRLASGVGMLALTVVVGVLVAAIVAVFVGLALLFFGNAIG